MIFNFFKKQPKSAETTDKLRIKVVITAFDDDCPENTGQQLATFLKACPFLESIFDESAYNPEILSLESRNFYDLVDKGRSILKRTKADVLIWGCRENNKIRINFQTLRQYEKKTLPYFSLLQKLYLPIDLFNAQKLPRPIFNLLIGIILTVAQHDIEQSDQTLEKIVETISRDKLPPELDSKSLPYIYNILALIYLRARPQLSLTDIKIAETLLNAAFKNAENTADALLLGSIYANFGQLYQKAAQEAENGRFEYCQKALEALRAARKYFNKHAFPYDYGLQTYGLAKMFFVFWQQTSDMQALRDAIAQLRDAEKIFSSIAFPYLWADIQGDLGYNLSILGTLIKNDDIAMMAIEHLQNRQKIYSKENRPLIWAKAETDIGEIYYNCGKRLEDAQYLNLAIEHLAEADEIYENLKKNIERRRVQTDIAKAAACLERLEE